jgi:hypothetical protein
MSNELDEDLQGLLKALAALVAVFGALALLLALFGPSAMPHLFS